MPLSILEICIDSLVSALAAEKGGAHRVELCDNLIEGGTTPSLGMVERCKKVVSLGIMVMIRPRGGDFLYDEAEFEVMKQDIAHAKNAGVQGVVFGILHADGRIDKDRVAELIRLARPLEVTFHRAFDMTPDPFEALDDLMELGVDRLLTSGQEAEAFQGIDLIARLVKYAGDKIIIMPGGGVNEKNVREIIRSTGASECHTTAKTKIGSAMIYQNPRVYMGSPGSAEYERWVVSETRVKEILQQANE
ncbi:MAG: copper homeostasis protein CutC [Bacteroidia bacterium]|nr:copper homeostasis protein CutC [Bacteroidia bacterium]